MKEAHLVLEHNYPIILLSEFCFITLSPKIYYNHEHIKP